MVHGLVKVGVGINTAVEGFLKPHLETTQKELKAMMNGGLIVQIISVTAKSVFDWCRVRARSWRLLCKRRNRVMGSPMIETLLAKQEIYDLLCDYMHAQDRLDPQLHRAVFHDDATTDYGHQRGSADDFVVWAQSALASMIATHHMLGQVRIDIEGEIGFGEVYFQGFHRLELEGEVKDLTISGRYVDRYEKREGRWKIAHRTELVDWERVERATPPFLDTLGPGTNWGKRGDADPSRQRDRLRGL